MEMKEFRKNFAHQKAFGNRRNKIHNSASRSGNVGDFCTGHKTQQNTHKTRFESN